jgi:hypothetical protein
MVLLNFAVLTLIQVQQVIRCVTVGLGLQILPPQMLGYDYFNALAIHIYIKAILLRLDPAYGRIFGHFPHALTTNILNALVGIIMLTFVNAADPVSSHYAPPCRPAQSILNLLITVLYRHHQLKDRARVARERRRHPRICTGFIV